MVSLVVNGVATLSAGDGTVTLSDSLQAYIGGRVAAIVDVRLKTITGLAGDFVHLRVRVPSLPDVTQPVKTGISLGLVGASTNQFPSTMWIQ